jgi:D-serine deaminase-like pyridoxal phosphate-dependent protein
MGPAGRNASFLNRHNEYRMQQENWFALEDPSLIDTPALLVFRDRVIENIDKMIAITGDPARLIPHVKTHKMQEIVALQIAKGIKRFKCATIAEAEMIARAGAAAVLVAYQLNEPKVDRFLELAQEYPRIAWSSLVDNIESARLLDERSGAMGLRATVFIDIDNGMHRTGIAPEPALELVRQVGTLLHVRLIGLHAYDGHIRDADFAVRRERCEKAMEPVRALAAKMVKEGFDPPMLIAGGTPSLTVHATHPDLLCSPGTCLLWDAGYGQLYKEQSFLPAAVLMTRVVSRPGPGLITTDLGHKSIAAENPIDKRVFFLNLQEYTIVSQSEEHLVVQVPTGQEPAVGSILYAVPYHICPSVAVHDEARIIEKGVQVSVWPVIARRRKISI